MREEGREKQVQMYYVDVGCLCLSHTRTHVKNGRTEWYLCTYVRTYVHMQCTQSAVSVRQDGCVGVGVHVGVRVNCCLPLEEICPALEQSVSELSGVRSSHSTCSKAGGCRRPGRR